MVARRASTSSGVTRSSVLVEFCPSPGVDDRAQREHVVDAEARRRVGAGDRVVDGVGERDGRLRQVQAQAEGELLVDVGDDAAHLVAVGDLAEAGGGQHRVAHLPQRRH
jgi:hypothetical protein